MKPNISVIVPVYNVEQYLDRCINSVISQTYSNFELILVDDGSPDCCGSICEGWATNDERIKVFHKENGGLSDARNFGIEKASGNYITFIDSDDYVEETYLEYLLSLFEYSETAKVTAANHTVVRGENFSKNVEFRGVKVFSKDEALQEVLYHGLIDVSAWGKLYKREVFDNLRFPIGRLFEDTYLFGDILLLTEDIVYGGEAQYFYVQRKNSIVNSKFNSKNLQFIESVERFISLFEKDYPQFSKGFLRRRVHAKLSVLRYLENCDSEFVDLRKKLKREILSQKSQILFDKKAPKRDKLAIVLLILGTSVFYKAWNFYDKKRG